MSTPSSSNFKEINVPVADYLQVNPVNQLNIASLQEQDVSTLKWEGFFLAVKCGV